MKIAFYNIFGEMKNAEQETLLRLEYCFKKQGHTLIVFDRNGFVVSEGVDQGKYVEDAKPDFMFTYNNLELAIITFPDVFSIFFHWSPLGFVANFQTLLAIKTFNLYDTFAGTYELGVFNEIDKITTYDIPFIGSSVPADFALKARKQSNRKLFYVGINFERKLIKMRYEDLFKSLDVSNQIEIYGPKQVYGVENLWAGFNCYKGEIPFDGHSILKKINQAGCCLALNSPMHNDANGVSNRTYEAAAAGALIISDDNEFVKHYFKDTVFYIDQDLSEIEASKKILNILDWANNNPDDAYQMAKASNEIFMKKLSLDKMLQDTIKSVSNVKNIFKSKSYQRDVIDVICFIDSAEEFKKVNIQLQKQYYQNLHMIIIADIKYQSNLKLLCPYECSFVEKDKDFKGKSFFNSLKFLRGKYFMFIDAHQVLHQRHIYKNLDVLKNMDAIFSYSGCYLKNDAGYITLNSSPILRDEFLSFSQAYGEDWHARDVQSFFIETIFSRSSALFKREICTLIEESEIVRISDSVHFYLACCSIIKASKLGRFTYACTTGYQGSSLDEINKIVFANRKHWHSNCRSAKTYIKEMNEVFFKYSFETTPNFRPRRSLYGEICWFKELEGKNLDSHSVPESIIVSKWMQKLLSRANKYGITRLPRFVYKIFSFYCKSKSIFKREKK